MTPTNRFVGLTTNKTTKFLGLDIEINKLSINQVLAVQAVTKAAEADTSDASGIKILRAVVTAGAKELSSVSELDFQDFPMEDLATLSNEIMGYSGLLHKSA
jgi:hypothetical protein